MSAQRILFVTQDGYSCARKAVGASNAAWGRPRHVSGICLVGLLSNSCGQVFTQNSLDQVSVGHLSRHQESRGWWNWSLEPMSFQRLFIAVLGGCRAAFFHRKGLSNIDGPAQESPVYSTNIQPRAKLRENQEFTRASRMNLGRRSVSRKRQGGGRKEAMHRST